MSGMVVTMLDALRWIEIALLLAGALFAKADGGGTRLRLTILSVAAFVAIYAMKTALFPTTRFAGLAPWRTVYLMILVVHAVAIPVGLFAGVLAIAHARSGAGLKSMHWRRRFVAGWRLAAAAGAMAFALLEVAGREA